jgi:hypothetical protein
MSRGDCGAYKEDAVGFLRRKLSNDLVPVHPDNISNNDWVILLEAGTIIGPTPQRIRVARWMQEKKIVKKYDMFLRTKYFIVVEGYNPRIHALYCCPSSSATTSAGSCRWMVRKWGSLSRARLRPAPPSVALGTSRLRNCRRSR